MISKAKIKYIRSLEQKKQRKAEKAFVAEGPKVVGDLLPLAKPLLVAATAEWLRENAAAIPAATEMYEVDAEELRKISFLQHPQQVIAVFPQCAGEQQGKLCSNELYIALDGVQDPGNLGTIIRIADWFGIKKIICSHDTVDAYNPKVVQATMGSIARVEIVYVDLGEFLDALPDGFPIYGTMLDGEDIRSAALRNKGIIVMGNEGNGISDDIARRLTHRLLIPDYPKGHDTADSLNVAIAAAITCFAIRGV